MNLTILLLGVNARYIHSSLSLYYLKQILQPLNYTVRLHEATINQPVDDTRDAIVTINPDVLCLSVYIWNTSYIKKLLPLIHTALPNCTIILGGPEVSYAADEWLKQFPFITTIVQGAGERSFEYAAQKQFSLGTKTLSLPNYHLNEIPFPYSESDINNLASRFIYYESSRGCPYACSYCLSSREDQPIQFRELQKVYHELDIFLQQKVRMVKFVDRTFNCNPTHARSIFYYLLSHNNNHTHFHFEIHPDLLFDEDFTLLQQVPKNYFQFEIGIQSIHPKTLSSINRKMNWERAKKNIAKLIELNTIHMHVDMICGLPYEDIEAIKESFNEIIGLKPHYFQMGFLKILPGTKIASQKNEFGIEHDAEAPYTVIKNKWISSHKMQALHCIERVVDSFYNHHFKTTWMMLNNFITDGDSFKSFEMIAQFFYKKKFVLFAKDWESIAIMVISFIKEDYPHVEELAIDCLRWDWFIQANSKWVPACIRSKTNPNIIREIIINNHKIAKNELLLDGKRIPLSTVKHAQIFIAESKTFRQWHMTDHHYAIKLHRDTILYIA